MNVMISDQLLYFLRSIILGVILGLIFDIFKILRLSIKHNSFFVFIEDVIYFFIVSILTYNLMINISLGQVRLFILIGELIGFILYKLSVSNIIVGVIIRIIFIIFNTITFIFKLIIHPVYKFIILVLKTILKPVIKFFVKYTKKIKKILKSRVNIVYNFLKVNFYDKVNFVERKK